MPVLVGSGVAELVLALALIGLGRWGARNADRLVPVALPSDERASRGHALLIGSRVCVGAGLLLAAFAAGSVVAALVGAVPTLTPQ